MSEISPRRRFLPSFVLGLGLLAPVDGVAQGADILTGVVIDRDSLPLIQVRVEAISLESEIVRTAVTDRLGRFTILFPDGGGQYRISAKRIGLIPAEAVLIRYADEDRLVWNVQMHAQALRLEDIEVTASSDFDAAWAETVLGRSFTAEELANLPVDLLDLTLLAMFADGTILLDPTDSTEAAISVGGLGPDANTVTVDGLLANNASTLPREGLESVEVLTDSYDVSMRGYGGASIRARTRGGTNNVRGSVRYSLHDPRLAFGETELSPYGRSASLNQLSGGIGGPLVRNKFFINVSLMGNLRSNPLRSLNTATPADLQRLGVAPDSVTRLLGLADQLGLVTEQRFGANQSDRRASALVRLDYLLTDRQTVTVTGNWAAQDSDPTRSSQLALTDVAGVSTSSEGAVAVSLASQLGLQWSNQFRASVRRERRDQTPFLYTPQARIRVASELADGSTGITTLTLGGNTGMPNYSRTTTLQADNQISWLSGGGGHRLRLGGNIMYRSTESESSSNQLGTFSFNSLAEFEQGAAASFRRTLAPSLRITRAMSYSVYGSDAWRVSPEVQLTYGLRFDGATNPSPPPYNPTLDVRFGRRTDRLPSTLAISPSASFTWSLPGAGSRPALIVRGGARLTQGRGGNSFVSSAQRATGLADSEQEINCTGVAVPVLDWLSYVGDPNAVPTACFDGTAGNAVTSGVAPTATVFSDGYRVARSLRTSLSLQRHIASFLRATVSGSYTRGMRASSVTDLNLNTGGGFRLAAEDNRPVFVSPEDITPSTGAVRLTDSRIYDDFGQVRDVASEGISEAVQLTTSLRGSTNNGITLTGSYTWSHVRDRVTGLSGGNTAGDPNALEWGSSSRGRIHAFSLSFGYPIGTNLEISASGRFQSGSPYTPIVGGDLNGDGSSRNDRAFIFAPDAPGTDPTLSAEMQRLLERTSPSARSCLEAQFGQLATRNSCTGPWTSRLDLAVNYRPPFLGLDRKLSISVRTTNLLRGLDDLFHGAANARGWGMNGRPNSTLLFVSGFDPATRQFEYAVNERFGVSDPRAIASRPPFQLTISASYQFGPDRRRAAVDRLRGIRPTPARGGGGRGSPAPSQQLTAQSFRERLSTLVMSPAAVALELRDSLRLTADQIAQLTTLGDSVAARTDALVREVETRVELSGQTDARALAGLLRTMTERAVAGARQDLAAVRAILTDEQWALLPRAVQQGAEEQRGPARRRRR
jgi:hypothetical protein